MSPKITQEQREAILANPDSPVEIEDDQTKRIYVLVPKDGFRRMVDAALQRELQIGFALADAGDFCEVASPPEDTLTGFSRPGIRFTASSAARVSGYLSRTS